MFILVISVISVLFFFRSINKSINLQAKMFIVQKGTNSFVDFARLRQNKNFVTTEIKRQRTNEQCRLQRPYPCVYNVWKNWNIQMIQNRRFCYLIRLHRASLRSWVETANHIRWCCCCCWLEFGNQQQQHQTKRISKGNLPIFQWLGPYTAHASICIVC